MHYIYILYSERIDQYYKGQTKHVESRLSKHNKGHSIATKKGMPWELKKVVEFESKADVIKAESWLKRMRSRRLIEQLFLFKLTQFSEPCFEIA